MIKASEFRIDSAQLVAFTPISSEFSPATLLASVMSSTDPPNVFDGEMIVFPLPQEVPPDVPRVNLQSKDKHWVLIASKASIRVNWTTDDTTEKIPDDAIEKCAKILLSCFAKKPGKDVDRFGFLVQRTAEVPNPAQQIIERFCSKEVSDPNAPLLRNSKGFELHNLKTYNCGSFQINSWIRVGTGHYKDEKKTPIVSVRQDLNTPEDQELTLRAQQIPEFFGMAKDEADTILKLYFPD